MRVEKQLICRSSCVFDRKRRHVAEHNGRHTKGAAYSDWRQANVETCVQKGMFLAWICNYIIQHYNYYLYPICHLHKSSNQTCCSAGEEFIDGFVQDCSNSSALAMELLQSCTKPLIYSLSDHLCIWQCIAWYLIDKRSFILVVFHFGYYHHT